MSAYFQLMSPRRVSSANYITFINPTSHPDRVMDEHDFLYMLDGSWRIMEENSCYEMHSDDLLILPAGRHHYGKGLCTPNNKHMIKEIFQEIISLRWNGSSLREDKLSLLINLLLCELKEQQEKPVSASSSHNILAEASRLIQTTPQTFFTGKDLADRFFVCERTLSNQFKKAYGKTLYAYQMDVKLEMVRQFLLSQPEVKLHETALNFGFCDEFHMSRTFKRKYGVSPSQYRQENLGS